MKIFKLRSEYQATFVNALLGRSMVGSNRDDSNLLVAEEAGSASAVKREPKEPEDDNDPAVAKQAKRRKVTFSELVEKEVRLTPCRVQDTAFKINFRMSRSTVECLLTLLAPSVNESLHGKFRVSSEVGTLLSLWMLGNDESLLAIALRFGLNAFQCYGALLIFFRSLSAKKKEFIAWSTGDSAARSIEEFSDMFGASFPHIVGCAGITNIKLTPDKERSQVTYLQLQAICDSSMTFFDVFAELPSDDGQVWTISPGSHVIRNWEENMLPPDAHLLASLAYPLHEHVMVPYKDTGRLTEKEKLFNSTLGSVRAVIKQAFGHLFGRFRRLKWLHGCRKTDAPQLIVAACILHNFCIMKGDSIPDGVDVNSAVEVELAQGAEILLAMPDADAAARKRNCIADLIGEAHET